MTTSDDNLLGNFLKDRRAKLDPAAFGFGSARRWTPGLRREKVAQHANVSARDAAPCGQIMPRGAVLDVNPPAIRSVP